MSLISLVALGALVSGAVFLTVLVLPEDVRRGFLAGLAVSVLFLASSSNVPPEISLGVECAAVGLVALGLLLPGGSGQGASGARVWVVVLMALAVVVTSFAGISANRVLLPVAAIFVGMAFLASRFGTRDRRVFLGIVVIFSALEVGFGLVECFITHEPLLWGYRSYGDDRIYHAENPLVGGSLTRVQGTTGHPIPFGALISFATVVVLAAWKSFPKIVLVGLVLVFATGILLSGSRSVILAVLLAVAFLLVTSSGVNRSLRVLLAALVAITLVVINFDELAALVEKLLASGSYDNRLGAIESVPDLLGRGPWENLFGTGVGSQPELYARGLLPQSGFTIIDNEVVTTLATLGIAGVIVLVLIFRTALRGADRTKAVTLIVFGILLFSFDYVMWISMVSLFGAFVGMPGRRAEPTTVVDTDPGALLLDSGGEHVPDRGSEKGQPGGAVVAPEIENPPSPSSAREGMPATKAVSRRLSDI